MPGKVYCQVVTPEATVLDRPADFVALPLLDGEIGIAPDRAPLIGRLTYGEMRVRDGETVSSYYVDGGFVQVLENRISVITPRAVPASELDQAAARQLLDESRRRKANTPELAAIRNRLIAQARAQLRVARHRHR